MKQHFYKNTKIPYYKNNIKNNKKNKKRCDGEKMNKLSKLITEMEYEDLKLIKKDLDEGNITKILESKINEYENKKETICPVCHNVLNNPDNETFTLIFGEKGFRKKATFCATDCLEYFLSHIKKLNEQKIKNGEHNGTTRNNQDL